jgi:hypothetical protein
MQTESVPRDTAAIPERLAEFCERPSHAGEGTAEGAEVPLVRLSAGSLFRPALALRCVVREFAQWESLRRYAGELPGSEVPLTPVHPSTFVDSVIIVASQGEQSTGGFDVTIAGVRADSRQASVVVRSAEPGDELVTQGFTHPVSIVRIALPSVPVRFVER